ncbi:MAG: hypothetical protein JF593_13310 [Novosphingobium sp.]|nr:hypothetical protein [Novosphingobium sp.]
MSPTPPLPRPVLARLAATAALALTVAVPVAGHAQPADLPIQPATTDKYPAGIKVVKTPAGAVYVDSHGRTLYGMDMRVLLRAGPDPSQHCDAECTKTWEPLLATGMQPNIRFPGGGRGGAAAAAPRPAAPAAAGGQKSGQSAADERVAAFFNPATPTGYFTQQSAPDWTVIDGPQGPQWVYKGWHMVFVRKGDKPGSTAFDGAEDKTWNTLKFMPPVPKLTAPGGVQPIPLDGGYVLADKQGRVLFTCTKACPGEPLGGGMASAPLGDWSVSRTTDRPQWTYRGKPVFASLEADPKTAPAAAQVLRP